VRRGSGTQTVRILLASLSLWVLVCAMASAGTVTYIYTDPQGTPLMEVDPTGATLRTFDYKPYGALALGSTSDGPGFTGHVNDQDIGMIYMQARYYDPTLGLFLSVDPIKLSPGDTFSLSDYLYVKGNPIRLVDPFGAEPKGAQQMDICNMPVPCSVNSGGTGRDPVNMLIYKVFAHYSVDMAGQATLDNNFPAPTLTALYYILSSPYGQQVAKEVLAHDGKIGLGLIPNGMAPTFRFDAGTGLVLYTLRLSDYKATLMNHAGLYREVKDQTLDVVLMHEIGHTPYGRTAFNMSSPISSQLNEFEDIRKVENPYRSFYGIPLRESSNGYDIPNPIIQK